MSAPDLICAAIAQRRLLLFAYNDRQRLAYPCAHGHLSTGNEALRAHEVTAVDGHRRVSAGKLFLVVLMFDIALSDEPFEHPPHGYHRDDRGMVAIHCQL
jgi:hypothetical protein